MLLSPITKKPNVAFEQKIQTSEIIAGYKEFLNLDVSRYFEGLSSIDVYKCLDTDYRFYYPFNVAGDGLFYDELQKHPWYYSDWKWEYQVVLDSFSGAGSLLEVGCGNGAFLQKMQAKGKHCLGLELSQDAIEIGRRSGLAIKNSTIEQFAANSTNEYDLVCSFQVLEHISSVSSFIEASVSLLNKGGNLVVAVPNNDLLFFRYKKKNIQNLDHLYQITRLLNQPPHHMGLWNADSLKKLGSLYGLKLERVLAEPFREHRNDLSYSILSESLGIGSRIFEILPSTYKKAFLRHFFKKEFLHGDSLVAVYSRL